MTRRWPMSGTSISIARRARSLVVRPTTPERKSTCLIPVWVRCVTLPVCAVASSREGTQVSHPSRFPKVLASAASPMKSASAVTPETRTSGRSTCRWSAQNASAWPPTSSPAGEQMARIFRTSSAERGASAWRSFLIEAAGNAQHPGSARTLRGDHVFLAPGSDPARGPCHARLCQRTRGEHHGNEPAVLDDLHTAERRHVIQQPAEIVLGVTRRHLLSHLAILAKTCSGASAAPTGVLGQACPVQAHSHGVLSRLPKGDVRPALERQLQIHPRRREVDERPRMIHRQVLVRPAAKLLQLLRIRAVDPARGMHVDRLE